MVGLWAICILITYHAVRAVFVVAGELHTQRDAQAFPQYSLIVSSTGEEIPSKPTPTNIGFPKVAELVGLATCLMVICIIASYLMWLWGRRVQVAPLKPSLPLTGFLQLGEVSFQPGYSTLGVGRELRELATHVNRGSAPVRNAVVLSSFIVESTPNITNRDQAARNGFEDGIKQYKADYYAGKMKGVEVGVGGAMGGEASWTLPNRDYLDGIMDGTLRIYFVSWDAWENYEGRKDEVLMCRWLEQPKSTDLTDPYKVGQSNPRKMIWQDCGS